MKIKSLSVLFLVFLCQSYAQRKPLERQYKNRLENFKRGTMKSKWQMEHLKAKENGKPKVMKDTEMSKLRDMGRTEEVMKDLQEKLGMIFRYAEKKSMKMKRQMSVDCIYDSNPLDFCLGFYEYWGAILDGESKSIREDALKKMAMEISKLRDLGQIEDANEMQMILEECRGIESDITAHEKRKPFEEAVVALSAKIEDGDNEDAIDAAKEAVKSEFEALQDHTSKLEYYRFKWHLEREFDMDLDWTGPLDEVKAFDALFQATTALETAEEEDDKDAAKEAVKSAVEGVQDYITEEEYQDLKDDFYYVIDFGEEE